MFRVQLNTSLAMAVTILLLLAVAPVLAADPTPGPSPSLIDPLDPRAGEGASQIGAPLLALIVVVGLGIGAAVISILYLRVARR